MRCMMLGNRLGLNIAYWSRCIYPLNLLSYSLQWPVHNLHSLIPSFPPSLTLSNWLSHSVTEKREATECQVVPAPVLPWLCTNPLFISEWKRKSSSCLMPISSSCTPDLKSPPPTLPSSGTSQLYIFSLAWAPSPSLMALGHHHLSTLKTLQP